MGKHKKHASKDWTFSNLAGDQQATQRKGTTNLTFRYWKTHSEHGYAAWKLVNTILKKTWRTLMKAEKSGEHPGECSGKMGKHVFCWIEAINEGMIWGMLGDIHLSLGRVLRSSAFAVPVSTFGCWVCNFRDVPSCKHTKNYKKTMENHHF